MAHNTAYQICFMITCVITSWLFISFTYIVLRYILFNPARLKKYHIHKPMLYFALFVWITLALRNIIQAFLLNNFIIPFQDQCFINSTCLQCHATVKLSNLFLILSYGFILSIFANALKANFMPLCSNKFYCKLKFYSLQFWIICLTIAVITQLLSDPGTNFKVIQLSDNSSKYICRRTNYLADTNIFVRILRWLIMITLILIVCIFLFKSCRILRKTSAQISKIKFSQINSFEKVKRLMDAIIRHTIISVAVIIFPFVFWLPPYFTGKQLDLTPFAELTTGICIYMLFRFGNRKYKMIFGCIHKRILNKWINKHQRVFTNTSDTTTTTTTNSDVNSKSFRETNISSVPPPSMGSLSTIHEEVLEKRAEEILHQNDLFFDIEDPL